MAVDKPAAGMKRLPHSPRSPAMIALLAESLKRRLVATM
jgi:hypothetical protein